MYQFTDDCRLGISQIDAEHQYLFQLINEAHSLMSTETDLGSVAANLLLHLKGYANTHFAHEEAYMEQINDPELTSQKQEHSDFLNTVNEISFANIAEEDLKSSLESLLEYLSRWLFHHIIGSDTLIGKFESPFSFTPKYFTGVDIIDTEHRQLFAIIGEANDLIHAELLHDKYDGIMQILAQLREYTEIHFRDEEEYMTKIHYPDLDKQKAAHAFFIEKLDNINFDDMDDNQQKYLTDLINFLLEWLSGHILHMDKRIGEYAASIH